MILIGIALKIGAWDDFAPFSLKKVENIKALDLIFINNQQAFNSTRASVAGSLKTLDLNVNVNKNVYLASIMLRRIQG